MAKEYETVMDEAKAIIFGEREEQYGEPERSQDNIAEMWNIILKDKLKGVGAAELITGEDVCLMMAGLKLVRLVRDHNHRDSLVDLIGYAGLLERVQKERANG